MLKHLVKIALRNFLKNKFYSSINILGLALGICFCLVASIYISRQYSVNKNLRHAERQFVLKTKWKKQDMGPDITTISMLAKGLKEEYPHIVSNYYRYNPVTNIVSAGDRFFQEDIAIGDTTLVSMYDFRIIEGNPKQAFTNSRSAVITESLARKLFKRTNAIGRTISIQTTQAGIKQDFIVSGVLEDIPFNSVTHIIGGNYSVFVPFTGNQYFGYNDFSASWENLDLISFVELQPGKTAIDQILKQNSPDFISKNLTANAFPVSDYHLKDNNNALAKMMMILSVISVFVLLMVVINFINISVGRSTSRLKEVSLKKAFGSSKHLITRQFLLESFVLTFIATVLSLIIYQLVKPLFSEILGISFPAVWSLSVIEFIYLLIILIGLTLLAGSYPALILSKVSLVNAVKGKLKGAKGNIALQRSLLVMQFALAIFVFICAINISNQLRYLFTKDLGYNKEQLLIVTALPKQWDSAGVARMTTVKQEIAKLPGVNDISIAFEIPDQIPFGKWEVLAPNSTSADGQFTLSLVTSDEDYASTLGLTLVNGNFFNHAKDGIVLNQAAVTKLGETSDNILGKKIKTMAGGDGISVTGVVRDYHYSGMQSKIAPIGFLHLSNRNTYRYLIIKLAAGSITESLESVRHKWKEMTPNTPFNYQFMDEKFAALYKIELQLLKASRLATIVNLLIVFLGITGVVALMLQKRVKEIAVRKVLGAGSFDIIWLFLKEYAWLIVVASLIAWPMAFVTSEKVFEQFAYRTRQGPYSYLIAFALVGVLSFTLVTLQCLRTATANPVKNLKSD